MRAALTMEEVARIAAELGGAGLKACRPTLRTEEEVLLALAGFEADRWALSSRKRDLAVETGVASCTPVEAAEFRWELSSGSCSVRSLYSDS